MKPETLQNNAISMLHFTCSWPKKIVFVISLSHLGLHWKWRQPATPPWSLSTPTCGRSATSVWTAGSWCPHLGRRWRWVWPTSSRSPSLDPDSWGTGSPSTSSGSFRSTISFRSFCLLMWCTRREVPDGGRIIIGVSHNFCSNIHDLISVTISLPLFCNYVSIIVEKNHFGNLITTTTV